MRSILGRSRVIYFIALVFMWLEGLVHFYWVNYGFPEGAGSA